MKDVILVSVAEDGSDSASGESLAAGHGWYAYGITAADSWRHGARLEGLDGGGLVRLISYGRLAAVASPVDLRGIGAGEHGMSIWDPARLEAMVRGHQRVVEAVHRQGTLLPARFGCVYTSTATIAAALQSHEARFVAELARVEGCDEWEVRLYADLDALRETAAVRAPAVMAIQDQLRAAGPGRAYFLRRKLADELEAAIGDLSDRQATAAYQRLIARAGDGQHSPRTSGSRAQEGETEILRAAFLVRRISRDVFLEELRVLVEGEPGLRGEYSGPWPAYTFAALNPEGRR